MSNNTNMFWGVLAGTAIGAIAGVLYAPDKGINTRKRISDKAGEAKESLTESAVELKNSLVNSVISHRETLDSKLDHIITDASYKADDVINKLETKLKELKDKNKKLQKTA